ncbi:5-formyltetrahydrofolate cyclo-ligase [Bacillus sp. B15-48]|uniref:5-formyltetrahydrofolate cyclo-ligase n=1 Tax=Bacillus sp. B15-48 TaxID=1548601 RepID=UPI00193F9E2B|nr:5-formyltetrahydrofolate cyclo-ligase [Bacillus sp. B15-48]MBM4762294.1 5-formyltetrahydrofolate cyclo-ligase [Bacillus sp. B15-48]
MERKNQFRKTMKNRLDSLTSSLYEDLSNEITRQLFKDKSWQNAKTIGITISRKPEVDTYKIIQMAWDQGKRVAVPKCIPSSRAMEFRLITTFSQLEIVYSQLYEPKVSETVEIDGSDLDLLIVPGLAFTKEGFRIGFGGGYYDRYLTHFQGETLSLAFSMQLVAELPIEIHDVPVSKIITEEGVFISGD